MVMEQQIHAFAACIGRWEIFGCGPGIAGCVPGTDMLMIRVRVQLCEIPLT
jgi:hypothetical protein